MMKRQKSKINDIAYKKYEKESDASDEETELLRIKPQRKEIPSIEKNVEEGDTLQSLAIRYHCTIEELKRLNNIHKENEIFAKTTIKVPYRPFTMALAGVHVSGKSSPDDNVKPTTSAVNIDEFHVQLNENLSQLPKNNDTEVNSIIFNSSITQKHEEIEADMSDEEIQLLPQIQDIPKADPVISKLNCSGVDGGISWIGLIAFIALLIVALPLIYVFYIAEHPEKYQHAS